MVTTLQMASQSRLLRSCLGAIAVAVVGCKAERKDVISRDEAISIMVRLEGPVEEGRERIEASERPLTVVELIAQHPAYASNMELRRLSSEQFWFVQIYPVGLQFGGDRMALIRARDGMVLLRLRGK